MSKLEEYKELKDKISELEHNRILPLERTISDIKIEFTKNSCLTQQNIDSNKELIKTLKDISNTMQILSESSKENTRKIVELSDKTNNMNLQLGSLETKLDSSNMELKNQIKQVDDKTKIDTSLITKQSYKELLLKVSSIGGAIIIVIELIMRFGGIK